MLLNALSHVCLVLGSHERDSHKNPNGSWHRQKVYLKARVEIWTVTLAWQRHNIEGIEGFTSDWTAGVLCEIVKEDGSMARKVELQRFAKDHDLSIITIADLVRYRLYNENLARERKAGRWCSPMFLGFQFSRELYLMRPHQKHTYLMQNISVPITMLLQSSEEMNRSFWNSDLPEDNTLSTLSMDHGQLLGTKSERVCIWGGCQINSIKVNTILCRRMKHLTVVPSVLMSITVSFKTVIEASC